MKSNQPDMNIENQINAGLNDVRKSMIALSDYAKTPDISDQHKVVRRVSYEMAEILLMIKEHRFDGIHRPWSDRKHQVEEEFS